LANTSDSFKTGEMVILDGDYLCVECQQTGKSTIRSLEKGKIFPYCDTCGKKDSTYRLTSKQTA
jgi:hypothetical protein